ncbi:MAG: sigma-54 dependent transcriptional regulator [Brevinematales bacterium]|nr:sigma-54 dependent transcriptional regulator [Brevinematales bacterium]
MAKPLVLVVDDEKNIREGLKTALKLENFEVVTSEDGKDGLEKLKLFCPDAVILDLKIPHISGMDFLKKVQGVSCDTPVIILTGHGGVDEAVEAMKRGAYDFLTKPVNIEKLALIVNRAIEERKRKDREKVLESLVDEKYNFDNIIGNSKAFQEVLKMVKQVAPTDATVLISGESGTGKEVIANAIHLNSRRAKNPIVKVHCAALPETLLESELFGHEKGAFTGAISRKRGRFELADSGTIFLDEIGEISQSVQVKLLRVLQEHEFERVGGEETIKVDIRVITATNRDLKQLVEEGKFREDLYYRLNIINIHIPPLRERKEDIPLLIDYFLKFYNKKHGKNIQGIKGDALIILQNYRWPGNVRELQNLIENLVILCNKKFITEDILPKYLKMEGGALTERSEFKIQIGATLDEIEKEAILSTLNYTNWNKSKAAKILNIGRKTLLRKLEEYGYKNQSED